MADCQRLLYPYPRTPYCCRTVAAPLMLDSHSETDAMRRMAAAKFRTWAATYYEQLRALDHMYSRDPDVLFDAGYRQGQIDALEAAANYLDPD